MPDENKTTEPERLKLIYVGVDEGDFAYVLAETEQEAIDHARDDWGCDGDDDCLFDADVLGPAPKGLAKSDIVNGRIIASEHQLISWLLSRLRETKDK